MECPNCKYDLYKLENFDNIYNYHTCPSCSIELYLNYDEICDDSFEECWDIFEWEIKNKINE